MAELRTIKLAKLTLSAALVLALTFTFNACGGDSGGDDPSGSSSAVQGSSSSVERSSSSKPSSSASTPSSSSSSSTPSSSSSASTFGYCYYGDDGCFPMGTTDDLDNCTRWGKVVNSCGEVPVDCGSYCLRKGVFCDRIFTEPPTTKTCGEAEEFCRRNNGTTYKDFECLF